jgi:hypothetical protein
MDLPKRIVLLGGLEEIPYKRSQQGATLSTGIALLSDIRGFLRLFKGTRC